MVGPRMQIAVKKARKTSSTEQEIIKEGTRPKGIYYAVPEFPTKHMVHMAIKRYMGFFSRHRTSRYYTDHDTERFLSTLYWLLIECKDDEFRSHLVDPDKEPLPQYYEILKRKGIEPATFEAKLEKWYPEGLVRLFYHFYTKCRVCGRWFRKYERRGRIKMVKGQWQPLA
ncbi:hypothetical protein ADUPG1_001139, partial [Aduncisulcus paluster]